MLSYDKCHLTPVFTTTATATAATTKHFVKTNVIFEAVQSKPKENDHSYFALLCFL